MQRRARTASGRSETAAWESVTAQPAPARASYSTPKFEWRRCEMDVVVFVVVVGLVAFALFAAVRGNSRHRSYWDAGFLGDSAGGDSGSCGGGCGGGGD